MADPAGGNVAPEDVAPVDVATVGEICAGCCGTQRESAIDCPLDCIYLREARRREPHGVANPEAIPNREIEVSEAFVRQHEQEFLDLGQALAEVMIAERCVDQEALDAVESLIQHYRSRESTPAGSKTDQPSGDAGADVGVMDAGAAKVQARLTAHLEESALEDSAAMSLLVFLQRLMLQHGNGRRRGRRFFELSLAVFAVPPKNGDEPGQAEDAMNAAAPGRIS